MAKKDEKPKEIVVENLNLNSEKSEKQTVKEKITRFSTKIMLLLIFSIISSSLFTGIIGIYNMSSLSNSVLRKSLTEKLSSDLKIIQLYIKEEYGELSYSEGKIVDSDGNSIEYRYELVDRVLKELNNNATIFLRVEDDFKRISTNIKQSDDKRAIDSTLETDNPAYKALLEGKSYIGETMILNKPFLMGNVIKSFKGLNKNQQEEIKKDWNCNIRY